MQEILFSPISSLSRTGPVLSKFLTRLVGGKRIFDLLLHKPSRIEEISICPRLFEAQNNELVILKLRVESHVKPSNSRQPYRVICYSPSGFLTLVFFKIFPSQIAKMPIGKEIAVLGNLQKILGENQITHPQEILPIEEIEKIPRLNVIYPLGAAITQRFLTQKIREVLLRINDENEEWIDENLLKKQEWPSFGNSLKNLHYFSENLENSQNKWQKSLQRLAFDEFLSWQIAILIVKNSSKPNKKLIERPKNNLFENFLQNLAFKPTNAQLKAIKEIEGDVFSTKKMLRLLQGDVGSGKTIVAISSCLQAISQGKQSCIIAPTTVLAKQHFIYFKKFLQEFSIKIEILTGATTKKQKKELLKRLFEGEIDILIGTHAIIEDDVKFKNLGLAVIDEQHRFGVRQRLKLVEKGDETDILLMSATPIPRSLMMGLYGDMEISILDEKPQNRQEIETLIRSAKKVDELYDGLKRALVRGEKIYWICPAIEELEEELENEPSLLVSVKEKFKELSKIFGSEKTMLLHGKMKDKEKEKIMDDFKNGEPKILIATTVIEVGIDVSDATIIVIENAENFGLAQLHQLRGRVGRGDKKSFCILLYGQKYGKKSQERLNILRQSNDGFFIAEEDLRMRGSGELLGTKQSGFPEFKIADLNFDSELLKIANKNAQIILSSDPKLQDKKYQDLLRLFGYDDCLQIILGG